MSIRFHSLKVQEVIRETHNAITIVMEKPADEAFAYRAGQYLTLKFDINGQSVRRAYSLCSSPLTDAYLAVTVKRVEGGLVSNHVADNLRAGDTIEVLPPMGNFHLQGEAEDGGHLVLIGGGSGITPMMAILKTVLHESNTRKVTLLYGNRDESQIIFHSALKELEAKFPDRLRVVHCLEVAPAGWTGLTGRLDRQVLLGLFQEVISGDSMDKTFWLCGPGGMMSEVEASLSFLGIPKSQVRKENFAAPLPSNEHATQVSSTGDHKRGDYTITAVLDGKSIELEVPESSTVLEALVDAGYDPPYACQMGVCCTCRALVKSGTVEMDEDEGLSDQEIEEGYVLTCQTHPLTPDVVLEYM